MSGFGWVNESMSLCVVCEDWRQAWPGSVFLILPFPSEGFWLRRKGAKWVESVPLQAHSRAGLLTTSEGSRYQGEVVRWSGLHILFRDPRSSLWSVWTPITVCRLACPASSLANSSDERVRFKIRLLANQSSLFCQLAVPRCHREPTHSSLDLEKSGEDLSTHRP